MNKIDWKRIWSDFNDWFCGLENMEKCDHCGSNNNCSPDWDEQEIKIQELVNGQVQEMIDYWKD